MEKIIRQSFHRVSFLILSLLVLFSLSVRVSSQNINAASDSGSLQLRLYGVDSNAFTAADYTASSGRFRFITAAVRPDPSVSGMYASIKIESADGETKLSQIFNGDVKLKNTKKTIFLKQGDIITIYHKLAKKVEFRNKTSKSTDTSLAPEGDANETTYIVTDNGITKKSATESKSDYQITMKGLGDHVFSTIYYSCEENTLKITDKAVEPHVYFVESYATITIRDRAGNVKYVKDYIGTKKLTADTQTVKLSNDDIICIFYAERDRITFKNISEDRDIPQLQAKTSNQVTSYTVEDGILKKAYLYDYQIQMRGLSDHIFTNVEYNVELSQLVIREFSVVPHSYFSNSYAKLTISDSQGNIKYEQDYTGNKRVTQSVTTLNISPTDTISIYYAEKDRLQFYNRDLTDKISILEPAANKTTTVYKVSPTGFQLADINDVKKPDGKNPDVREPDGNDPDVREPDVKDPDVKDPGVKDPDVKNPDVKDPDGNDPDVKEPDGNEPDIKEPDASDPDVKKPDTKEPDGKDPLVKDPDEKKPDGKNTDANKPEIKSETRGRKALGFGNLGSSTADKNNMALVASACRQSGIDVKTYISASKEQFTKALKEQFGSSTKDSVNYLFIACHGAPGAYLALFNNGGLSGAGLRAELDAIPGQFIIVIDACFSGSFIQQAEKTNDSELDAAAENFAYDLTSVFDNSVISPQNADMVGDKYHVITASDKDHSSYYGTYSFVLEKVCSSGCTNYKLDALSANWKGDENKDNNVTFREAFEYAKSKIGWTIVSSSSNEDIIMFSKDTKSESYDYQIIFEGLGNVIFATYNYNPSEHRMKIYHNGGSSHSYYTTTYAKINITDASGNSKYEKEFIGNVSDEIEEIDIALNAGDIISIYHAEATTRLLFNDIAKGEQDKSLKTVRKQTINYIVTENGLKDS